MHALALIVQIDSFLQIILRIPEECCQMSLGYFRTKHRLQLLCWVASPRAGSSIAMLGAEVDANCVLNRIACLAQQLASCTGS